MKFKRQGFTLVELLAVIVILAVIAAIAVPQVLKVIAKSQENAFKTSLKEAMKAFDQGMNIDLYEKNTEYNLKDLTNLRNNNFETGSIIYDSVKDMIIIYGARAGNYQVPILSDKKINGYVSIEDDFDVTYDSDSFGDYVNKPVLAKGMTPVKWNGSEWIRTSIFDSEWYNYAEKRWANVQTADGSMWVWIPRYSYKITDGYHTNTSTGTIDVKFLIDDTIETADGTSVVEVLSSGKTSAQVYVKHPAFTFDGKELEGIWIAKFEASVGDQTNACYLIPSAANCDKVELFPKIVPNAKAWYHILVGNAFTVSRNMETNGVYGWGTSGSGIDTHLIKNTEWGSAVYLAQSKYGLNSEIYKNNSSNYYTGRSGGAISGSQIKVGTNEYIDTGFYTYDGKCATTTTIVPDIDSNCTTEGNELADKSLAYKASTTGNIYGIYDMSGGAGEFIAAYVNNSNLELKKTGKIQLYNADSKYKDAYPKGTSDTGLNNYNAIKNNYGDAMWETSNNTAGAYAWYSQSFYIGWSNNAFFTRGGKSTNITTMTAGSFSIVNSSSWGTVDGDGFRPVIIVGEGL